MKNKTLCPKCSSEIEISFSEDVICDECHTVFTVNSERGTIVKTQGKFSFTDCVGIAFLPLMFLLPIIFYIFKDSITSLSFNETINMLSIYFLIIPGILIVRPNLTKYTLLPVLFIAFFRGKISKYGKYNQIVFLEVTAMILISGLLQILKITL